MFQILDIYQYMAQPSRTDSRHCPRRHDLKRSRDYPDFSELSLRGEADDMVEELSPWLLIIT